LNERKMGSYEDGRLRRLQLYNFPTSQLLFFQRRA